MSTSTSTSTPPRQLEKDAAIFWAVVAIVGVVYSLIELSYLGWSFHSAQESNLDSGDLRRSCIVVLAYLSLIPALFLLIPTAGATIVVVFWSVVTLTYLGWSAGEHKSPIKTDDWRRKCLIFFAWLNLAFIVFAVSMVASGHFPIEIVEKGDSH